MQKTTAGMLQDPQSSRQEGRNKHCDCNCSHLQQGWNGEEIPPSIVRSPKIYQEGLSKTESSDKNCPWRPEVSSGSKFSFQFKYRSQWPGGTRQSSEKNKKCWPKREAKEVSTVRSNWFFNINWLESMLQWSINGCAFHYCELKMLLVMHRCV